LAVKQQHDETEDERASDRRSVITEGQDASDLSKTQKAKACGYYTVTKGGGERVNLLQFLKALLEAEGIALDEPALSVVEMDAAPITGLRCKRMVNC
jgi:hypothetical protein